MKNIRLLQLAGVFILFLGIAFSANAQAPATPGNPELYQATFTRAIISWLPSAGTPAPDGYKVYRDSVEIATVTQPEYTDTGLTPDTTYVYTVKAYAGNDFSMPSATLTARTLKGLDIENASVIQQIVDSIDPLGMSASDLITAVQDALTALNYVNVDFTEINVPILNSFINREKSYIETGVQPSSDSARVTDQQELDQYLLDRFMGHSFIELYLHSKLLRLGEDHWQNGRPDAAESLYDFSLNFMSDYRDYDSKLGRWRSRDSIEESGEANLYGMCLNKLINDFDFLGEFNITVNNHQPEYKECGEYYLKREFIINPGNGEKIDYVNGIVIQSVSWSITVNYYKDGNLIQTYTATKKFVENFQFQPYTSSGIAMVNNPTDYWWENDYGICTSGTSSTLVTFKYFNSNIVGNPPKPPWKQAPKGHPAYPGFITDEMPEGGSSIGVDSFTTWWDCKDKKNQTQH